MTVIYKTPTDDTHRYKLIKGAFSTNPTFSSARYIYRDMHSPADLWISNGSPPTRTVEEPYLLEPRTTHFRYTTSPDLGDRARKLAASEIAQKCAHFDGGNWRW